MYRIAMCNKVNKMINLWSFDLKNVMNTNFNLQIPVNCCHFQSDVCSFLLCYVLISLALTRGLRPEKLQLNVCFHFLFVIKDIFNHLLAHKIKTIKYLIRRWGQNQISYLEVGTKS